MCHIKILKAYVSRDGPLGSLIKSDCPVPTVLGHSALIVVDDSSAEDDLMACHSSAQLSNLKVLPSRLNNLTNEQGQEVVDLIKRFPCLFGDILSQTNVLKHDIDVHDARPIKQHQAVYLPQNGLAIHSSKPPISPCLVESKSDGYPHFITDF